MKITCLILLITYSCCFAKLKAQIDITYDKDTIEQYISELEAQEKIASSPLLVVDGIAIDYDDFKNNNQSLLKTDRNGTSYCTHWQVSWDRRSTLMKKKIMLHSIGKQFRKPSGLLGRIVSLLMKKGNRHAYDPKSAKEIIKVRIRLRKSTCLAFHFNHPSR